jgi:prepilin-type N-terminal cleavage/methylation domain-containing protein
MRFFKPTGFPVHVASCLMTQAGRGRVRTHLPGRLRGFSLMELTVVLAVIGLILGAVAIGKDVQRNAAYQRLSSEFVQGWLTAYDTYWNVTGRAPGDSSTTPTGAVNGTVATGAGNGTPLCDNPTTPGDPASLLNVMLAAGVRLPPGRKEGSNNRYAYLDSNGNPQEVRLCFQNVMWAEPGASVGTYVSLPRNVMVLTGVTPSLARMIDAQIDTQADARFGRVRVDSMANATGMTTPQEWPLNDAVAFGDTTASYRDESQVAVLTVYVQMSR